MVKLPTVDQMISLVRKPGAPPLPGAPREARLRDAFEHAPVGIALASIDGAWLQFNERFRELAGYTREQLSRLTFTDLTHPDDARREATLMRRMLSGDAGGYRIEKRIIEKKGKYREVEVVCAIAGAMTAHLPRLHRRRTRAHSAGPGPSAPRRAASSC